LKGVAWSGDLVLNAIIISLWRYVLLIPAIFIEQMEWVIQRSEPLTHGPLYLVTVFVSEISTAYQTEICSVPKL
jgi:hypothetical protein